MPVPVEAEDWHDRFPFVHDAVPFAHGYERVRVEEKAFSFLDLVKDVKYLTKMRKKMPHSSAEVERHFEDANAIGPDALSLAAHYDLPHGGDSCSLGAVGDVMYIPDGMSDFLRPPFLERIRNFDFLFGNLETPADPSQKPGMISDFGLRFNVAPAFLDTLATGGAHASGIPFEKPLFDVLSLANNHVFDRGTTGLKRTLHEVAKRGLVPIGVGAELSPAAERGRHAVVERAGFKLGFIAFTWGSNLPGDTPEDTQAVTIAPFGDRTTMPDFGRFEALVARARAEGAECIVLSLHWGYEFEYYPEPHFMKIAREFAARGASLIIGHGPHVLQPMEVLHVNVPEYRGTSHHVTDPVDPSPRVCLVAYSLGNFTTIMNTGPCRLGGLLSVKLARALERGTGRERCLVTEARLHLSYAQKRAAGGLKRHVAIRDVAWALSPSNPKERLRMEVARALAESDLHRLGGKWLQVAAARPALSASSHPSESVIERRGTSLAVTGRLLPTPSMGPKQALLRIDGYEPLDGSSVPPQLIRHLRVSENELFVTVEDEGLLASPGARKVTGTLILPTEDSELSPDSRPGIRAVLAIDPPDED